MPSLSVMFGVVLTALGLVAYFNPEPLGVGKDGKPADPGHPSSLAPAGVVSMALPAARKHAMHGAAAVSLFGVIGGLVPVILRGAKIEEVAVKVGLGMAVLSVVFLALCVSSFVRARKAREIRNRTSVVPKD